MVCHSEAAKPQRNLYFFSPFPTFAVKGFSNMLFFCHNPPEP
jgi:hypothetical protein